METIGIRTGRINKYEHYSIHKIIIANQESMKLFQKIVNFKHPTKREKLNKAINEGWKFKRYYNYECKKKILELLNENEGLETKQLSIILKRNNTTIRNHLKNLINEKKIYRKIINIKEDDISRRIKRWYLIKNESQG